jgi:CheY-like chemotaxis protein
VSVFVIDWTTTGCADPTGTPPTSTVGVVRREGRLTEFMVERVPVIGTRRASRRDVTQEASQLPGWQPRVWIVEDEPAAASLAAELCEGCGASASVFHGPLPYLTALRSEGPPIAVILDWRLERELSAAVYMATRHHYPLLPVIYWTGSPANDLPAMIRDDARTRVVDKAGGTGSFEGALAWALAGSSVGPTAEQTA